jgi:4-hydroxy-tetrahydrodipicolinate synthase
MSSSGSKKTVRLQGAITALVTPFQPSGEVDDRALRELVRWQVDAGIDALAPCGTTGEGATLSPDEQQRVIEAVVEAAGGRVPVVAGCGTNDTRRTVEGARRAEAAGADALLVVTPYYNKPNPSGMVAHYEAVAAATALPVVVYNVPGRTGQNLGVDLTLRLSQVPGIVAVKEASGSLEQIAAILERRSAGFAVLSGDDQLALPTVALGAEGLISVVSNVAPAETAALVSAARAGSLDEARAIHYRLLPLMRANFLESNPVPVKVALGLLGRCRDAVRPPLGPADPRTVHEIELALAAAGLARAAR